MKLVIAGGLAVVLVAGTALAFTAPEVLRIPVDYFTGHSHDDDGHTHGAPAHSGGTDRYGCHNGSVPYHCHR